MWAVRPRSRVSSLVLLDRWGGTDFKPHPQSTVYRVSSLVLLDRWGELVERGLTLRTRGFKPCFVGEMGGNVLVGDAWTRASEFQALFCWIDGGELERGPIALAPCR